MKFQIREMLSPVARLLASEDTQRRHHTEMDVFWCVSVHMYVNICIFHDRHTTVGCSVLQCVAATHDDASYATPPVLQCVAVCCSVLQLVAVCCSELQ